MKSMMRRPSEARPVGLRKKVSPKGRLLKGMIGKNGAASLTKLPVSAYELPKVKIDRIEGRRAEFACAQCAQASRSRATENVNFEVEGEWYSMLSGSVQTVSE